MWFGAAPRTYTIIHVLEKIKLRSQNMITILDSIINRKGGVRGYIFTLMMKIFIQAPKITRKVPTTSIGI